MNWKIARYIFAVILILCSVLVIRYRIKHQQYYHFQRVIKKEFSYIKKIDIANYGPHCTLYIYVNKNSCNYEKVEPAFIKIMVEISRKVNYQYFVKRHVKDGNGELPYFHVSFYEVGTKDNLLYKFTSENDFQVWELDSDRSIQYNVADYKD